MEKSWYEKLNTNLCMQTCTTIKLEYSVVALLFATPFQAPQSKSALQMKISRLPVVCYANVSLSLFSTQEIKQFATWACPHINVRFCPLLVFSLECEWPNLDRWASSCSAAAAISSGIYYIAAPLLLPTIQGEKPQVCMKLESRFCSSPLPISNHASYPQATIMLWSELALLGIWTCGPQISYDNPLCIIVYGTHVFGRNKDSPFRSAPCGGKSLLPVSLSTTEGINN